MKVYPWSAVVGQPALKRALLLCAIDPSIGGVLVEGPRGVAKTTLARALAELATGPFVELPLGATEERITGTLDLEAVLREQRVEFSPGLLARAHSGVLYVDEVNLLADPLVDVLLDAATSGQNVVEREGVSHVHPARFVLVGTMNPEEGALRPQLLDRFGLCVRAEHEISPSERAEIVRRRLAFDLDPEAFCVRFASEQRVLVERCQKARERLLGLPLEGAALELVSLRCHAAGVEGVRADLAMLRAARAHAAWHARAEITADDVDTVAELALAHRRRQKAAGGSAAGGGGDAGGRSGVGGGSSTSAATGRGSDAAAAGAGATAEHASAAGTTEAGAGAAARAQEDAPRAAADGGGDTAHSSGVKRRAEPGEPGGAASGALPAIPVPGLAPPQLPASITALRGRASAIHRRGAAQLPAARGRRGPGRSADGPIAWFDTLCQNSRPRRSQLIRRAARAPASQLWILVLDCSSSMLRNGGLAAAKGAAHALEARAAGAGAHVAVISFRGRSAETLVTSRAGRDVLERSIAALGGGGGTPLAQALCEVARVCESSAFRSREIAKRMVLLTDGRTRESLDEAVFGRLEVELLVIDCERGRVRIGRAAEMAAAVGGSYHHVDDFRAML